MITVATAAFWDADGSVVSLGPFIGGLTQATGINDVGQIVGTGSGGPWLLTPATYAGLCVLSRQRVTNTGMAQSMCDLLDAAQLAESVGSPSGKAGALGGYKQLVAAAQRAGFVGADDAARLVRVADLL
jgi:hypothetical protein